MAPTPVSQRELMLEMVLSNLIETTPIEEDGFSFNFLKDLGEWSYAHTFETVTAQDAYTKVKVRLHFSMDGHLIWSSPEEFLEGGYGFRGASTDEWMTRWCSYPPALLSALCVALGFRDVRFNPPQIPEPTCPGADPDIHDPTGDFAIVWGPPAGDDEIVLARFASIETARRVFDSYARIMQRRGRRGETGLFLRDLTCDHEGNPLED